VFCGADAVSFFTSFRSFGGRLWISALSFFCSVPVCVTVKLTISTTFYIRSYRTNVLLKSPVILMCNNFNQFATRCDIHFDSLKTILDAVECRLLSLES
jgi:hypothetical protein